MNSDIVATLDRLKEGLADMKPEQKAAILYLIDAIKEAMSKEVEFRVATSTVRHSGQVIYIGEKYKLCVED